MSSIIVQASSVATASAPVLITKALPVIQTTLRHYTAGATGSFRGEQSNDSFAAMEKAKEDFYVRKHEKELLSNLKSKLRKAKENSDELDSKVKEMK